MHRFGKGLFLLFLLVSATFCEAKIYNKLEFKGSGVDTLVGEMSSDKLFSVIGKPYPPFYAFWRKNPTFSDTEISSYIKRLKAYYESLGYYRVKITDTVTKDKIVIQIEKNEPIKVSSVKVAPDEEYRKLVLFKRGDIFRTDKFKESKEKIERYMLENAHPKYNFDAKAYVHLDSYNVDLDYHIEDNISCTFGDTSITGQGDVKKEIIEDAVTYKKGKPFDIRELEKTYDNIYEYGIYDYIAVEPKLDLNGSVVPVEIALKTGETKFLKTNIGYDTDKGARGGIRWTDKNFYGNLKVLDAGIQLNELGYETFVTYYDPRIILPYVGKITLEDEVKYSYYSYEAFSERVWENRFTLGKRFVGLEHYFGILTEKSTVKPKIPDYSDEAGNYFINSFFYRVLIDKRDSMIDATRGYYISLYLEKASSLLGSDLEYLKALLEMRYIKSFSPKSILGIKTRIGSINEDVPLFKRFYTGGSVTNRGYAYQKVGEQAPGGIPLGGVSLVDFLLEYRHQLFFDKFWMSLFYDTSMLSLKPHDYSDTFYDSVGFGIRYLTPIGPLRVDFGFPQKENGFEFHISIGQVF